MTNCIALVLRHAKSYSLAYEVLYKCVCLGVGRNLTPSAKGSLLLVESGAAAGCASDLIVSEGQAVGLTAGCRRQLEAAGTTSQLFLPQVLWILSVLLHSVPHTMPSPELVTFATIVCKTTVET